MSNRPARITQAEIERAIRAAKKAGIAEIELKIGDEASIRIPLGKHLRARSGGGWSSAIRKNHNGQHHGRPRSARQNHAGTST
jgi:hypothetical protein